VEDRRRNDVLLVIGLIVLFIGLASFARTLGIVPPIVWSALRLASRAAGPLALIVLGVIVIVVAQRGGLRGPTMPAAGTRLYRSRTDRMVAGVAGGLAEYLGVDPLLVRLGFVLLGLVSAGIAIVLYIILAVLVPERPIEGGAPSA
jgi:phage shock protein C